MTSELYDFCRKPRNKLVYLRLFGGQNRKRYVLSWVAARIHEPSTIVLIEDTLDDERLALRALQQIETPLLVKVARDGQTGLRALGLSGSADRRTPDLVLCDLKLPKVNGDEILRQARANQKLRNVPFVVFSSSDEPSDVARCREYGVTEYAVKPVDYDTFGERIRQIVEQHLPQRVGV